MISYIIFVKKKTMKWLSFSEIYLSKMILGQYITNHFNKIGFRFEKCLCLIRKENKIYFLDINTKKK